MLEFELKGMTYHIHRIPKQEKPKSRGQGFTEQKSEATLIELQDVTTETSSIAVKNLKTFFIMQFLLMVIMSLLNHHQLHLVALLLN